MSRISSFIQSLWQRRSVGSALLLPLAGLFGLLTALRRALFRAGVLKSSRLPVAVVVVGNLTVGGSGKTPLVIWLVERLRERGMQPGVISRGYGAKITEPRDVRASDSAREVGDEPLLIKRRLDCPVLVCPDRLAAGRALLAAHPQCDVIVCDDGLQHYRLKRDAEIVLIDGERRFGNGWLLPAGPLREPASRLESVDAVVMNGIVAGVSSENHYAMRLKGLYCVRVGNTSSRRELGYFVGKTVHAVAGIGHPPRFFAALRALGIELIEHAFADHHVYVASDFNFGDMLPVLMTEKDAVKCQQFDDGRLWALPVDAQVSEQLADIIMKKIEARRASQTA